MTTENPTLAQRISNAEALHRTKVNQALEDRASGATALAEVTAQLEAAEELVDEVRGALRSGDIDVPPSALTEAEAQVRGLSLRADGIRSRLDRARKAPTNIGTDAALGLVAMTRDALPGVPVYVMAGAPPEFTEADVPSVVLQQTQDSDLADGSQVRQGRGVEVVLHYVHNVTHREVDHGRFVTGANRHGVSANLHALSGGGWTHRHSDRLIVAPAKVTTSTPAPVPVVAVVGEYHGLGDPLDGLSSKVGGVLSRRADLSHEKTTASVSGQTSDNGIRTVTVRGTTTLRERIRPGGRARAELSDLAGMFIASIGRVVQVTEVSRTELTRTWEAQLVSRESADVPHPEAA